jgi:hypothetical protein
MWAGARPIPILRPPTSYSPRTSLPRPLPKRDSGPRVGYTRGVMTFDDLLEGDGCQPGAHARDRGLQRYCGLRGLWDLCWTRLEGFCFLFAFDWW